MRQQDFGPLAQLVERLHGMHEVSGSIPLRSTKTNFMDFKEYQQASRKTVIYPNPGSNIVYPALGLCGETGEVAEKIKKVIRDGDGVVSDEKKEELKKELGDVLWYVEQLSSELKLDLDDVAQSNIDKLYSRMDRGVLKGDGDNR
jgi:NTP pyrophosphatase (non-canonical NTP hydrolase)